jgi:hypothetical protein
LNVRLLQVVKPSEVMVLNVPKLARYHCEGWGEQNESIHTICIDIGGGFRCARAKGCACRRSCNTPSPFHPRTDPLNPTASQNSLSNLQRGKITHLH